MPDKAEVATKAAEELSGYGTMAYSPATTADVTDVIEATEITSTVDTTVPEEPPETLEIIWHLQWLRY